MCGGTIYQLPLGVRITGLSPRVRGNRIVKMQVNVLKEGLSPRVRGNRRSWSDVRPLADSFIGSIPACAGEPVQLVSTVQRNRRGPWTRTRRVYPRVCGGTRCHPTCIPASIPYDTLRSIPACAGEPSFSTCATGESPAEAEVYPRVCGGTRYRRFNVPPSNPGLSPRVRGNHRACRAYRRRSPRVPDKGLSPRVRGEP